MTTWGDLRKVMAAGEYEDRLASARERAEWELGDSSWADEIVEAFLSPDANRDDLAIQRGDDL